MKRTEQPPQFDAIVVGTGITGGWAAKELTEQGLKVLMLDRGKMVEHGRDYQSEHMPPWHLPFRGKPLRELYREDYFVQSQNRAFNETTRHFYNKDSENPYVYDPKQFLWVRADVVGGRSLLWARQVYRWSDLDFEANKKDGHGIDWPIRYADIAPWYRHVEQFIGVSGQAEHLPHLPDSVFLPAMDMNVVEKHAKAEIEREFPDRKMTIGRTAVLTKPHKGRAACHYCGPCERGCSAGAYFCTQSSTLPAAQKTGNLTLKADSLVSEILYDPQAKRATGVRVIDTNSREGTTYTAHMVFLCASTIASTQILMNSKSEAFPQGLANTSGALGHYLMDHTYATGALGVFSGFENKVTFGARPNGIYIPRFRNLDDREEEDVDFLRGYGYQGAASRLDWSQMAERIPGFGAEFKHRLRMPGPWIMFLNGFGECLPYAHNRIELDKNQKDRFGIPQVRFQFRFGDNEEQMRKDIAREAEAMLKSAGAMFTNSFMTPSVGGQAVHEMGSARMGKDPNASVLNRWNQTHDVPNLFVTDGACMTSSSCVNPSLTYMALTARATDYAVKQFKDGHI